MNCTVQHWGTVSRTLWVVFIGTAVFWSFQRSVLRGAGSCQGTTVGSNAADGYGGDLSHPVSEMIETAWQGVGTSVNVLCSPIGATSQFKLITLNVIMTKTVWVQAMVKSEPLESLSNLSNASRWFCWSRRSWSHSFFAAYHWMQWKSCWDGCSPFCLNRNRPSCCYRCVFAASPQPGSISPRPS